jgi:peptide/nickel transport system permease protein
MTQAIPHLPKPSAAPRPRPRSQALWRRLLRERRVVISGGLLLILALLAWFAPQIAPHDPNEQDLLNTLLPPAWMPGGDHSFPLGTDSLGQCVLSRLLYGARIALFIAVAAPVSSAVVGTVFALIAGYCGGWVDALISRWVEVWMSFPAVVLALVLMVALTPTVGNVVLAIVMVDWTRFCRVMRAEVLVLRRRDYVAAARIAGASHLGVLLRDILPGALPTLVSLISLEMGIAIVAESMLSFTGMSVGSDVPTWGVMMSDGLKNALSSPWPLLLPALCMMATVLLTSFLGDGVRRAMDARLLEREEAA